MQRGVHYPNKIDKGGIFSEPAFTNTVAFSIKGVFSPNTPLLLLLLLLPTALAVAVAVAVALALAVAVAFPWP